MNARTECEIEQMNSEYSMRIPEKAIIQFLDDYDEDSNVAEMLIELGKVWKVDIVKAIITCIKTMWVIYKNPPFKNQLEKENKNDRTRNC